MSGLWYHKYRPQTLDQYIWNDDSLRGKVEHWIAEPEDMPHLVLESKSPGTGKTSLALLLVQLLELSEGSGFLFQNASVFSGADNIRNVIIPFCETEGWGRIKVIILDEAERLTTASQEMLRGILDQYQHVRFIYTCNTVEKLISPLVDSRCQVFTMGEMDEADFANRLMEIVDLEGIEYDQDALIDQLAEITSTHHPNFRKALQTLQNACVGGKFDPETLSTVPRANADWMDDLVEIIRKKSSATKISAFTANLSPDEIQMAYRHLYETSNLYYGYNQGLAVVTIADYLYRNDTASFPHIGLSAALIRLTELVPND